MTAIVIIPARYDSTRFPGKPLAPLNSKPLIQHVYENSKKSKLAKDVIVATDSDSIFKAVYRFGGKAVMTSSSHVSGTDRIAEAAANLDYDIIVNVQGDEPLIKAEMIDDVIRLLDDERASIGTLVKLIQTPEEIFDPNVVKAVFDKEGFAMYFSRAPIPFERDKWEVRKEKLEVKNKFKVELGVSDSQLPTSNFYKHIGIYSYRREALMKISKMKPVSLEQTEKLEQLRPLAHGLKIKIKETSFETIGVDTPEDLERAEKWLSSSL